MQKREAPAAVPARHVARIDSGEMTGAGEPAQHPSAHLPLHRGEVFQCQRAGLGEALDRSCCIRAAGRR
jgi:hypothetical protein